MNHFHIAVSKACHNEFGSDQTKTFFFKYGAIKWAYISTSSEVKSSMHRVRGTAGGKQKKDWCHSWTNFKVGFKMSKHCKTSCTSPIGMNHNYRSQKVATSELSPGSESIHFLH